MIYQTIRLPQIIRSNLRHLKPQQHIRTKLVNRIPRVGKIPRDLPPPEGRLACGLPGRRKN